LQGVEGDVGAPVPEGEAGAAGATGEAGATGPGGAEGEPGPEGPPGADGAEGQTGSQGPVGATGPAGSNGLAEYAYLYNVGGQTVPVEGDVNFDSNGVTTAGIKHLLGGAGVEITAAGTYEVNFSVSATEPSQFAIFLDGSVVSGSVYGSGAGTQQNTGQAIVIVPSGGVLTIRNHSSAAAVGLALVIGGSAQSSNATLLIEKIA
jgi:hypothetical protein